MISTELPAIHQALQHFDQLVHIRRMQTNRRFIQHVQSPPGGTAGEFLGKLHPLGFTAGKRGGRLADLDIPQADLLQEFAAWS